MEELIRKIKQECYRYVGIRHLADDEEYNVGDICRNSYDWDYENDCSSYESNNPVELQGSCSFDTGIIAEWDDESEIRQKLENAIDASDCYCGRLAVIAGNRSECGSDDGEIIIKNAEVIYLAA